jgi:hypothetical protein
MTASEEIKAIAANPALLGDLRAREAAKKPTVPTDFHAAYRAITGAAERAKFRATYWRELGLPNPEGGAA